MRLLLSIAVGALLTAAGCTRANPDFCCVTPDACAAAGLVDELRPCATGEACRAYTCVAAECISSADCTSSEASTCLNGLCVAGCTVDDDCVGVLGRPRCDVTDATCVGCTSSDQCPADKAICDADARTCRGCTADEQCASGVCIEATGRCAPDGAIIYVMEAGTDAGSCPLSAPCKTMTFAMGLTNPTRNVIRILGGIFSLGNSPVSLTGVVIDGSNSTLIAVASPAILATGIAVLEGVRLPGPDPFSPLIRVFAGAKLQLARASIEDGQIEVVAGGRLEADNAKFRKIDLRCRAGGDLVIARSELQQGSFDSACNLVLVASRLEPAPGGLPTTRFQGPSQLIENNVFIGTDAGSSLMYITSPSGSTFRFNTVVNTTPVVGDAAAIGCNEGVYLTSNIIAYNSRLPSSCSSRYSLFDAAGEQEVGRGIGNRSANAVAFFEDRQAGNLHLSPNSPALGFGEPGLVSTDLEGNVRPVPAGSLPDVGAYEAP